MKSLKLSIAVAVLLYGALVLFSGGKEFSTGLNSASWGASYITAGLTFVFIGAIFLVAYLRDGANKRDFQITEDAFICPQCGEPYNESQAANLICTKCNVKLEELQGFYERHPEFK